MSRLLQKLRFLFCQIINDLYLIRIGFGIYYLDEQNEIESINFDIISSDLSQDSRAAVRGFRILRDQEFFKRIEKDSYIVWADCGKHFRNNEFVGFLLLELAQKNIHGTYT